MTIEMHPELWGAWYMADVTRELGGTGGRLISEPDLWDPALVLWTRTLNPTLTTDDGQVAFISSLFW
jgi:hypothetical protein